MATVFVKLIYSTF